MPKERGKDEGAVDVFGRAFELKTDMRQRDVAAWNRAYIGYGNRAALADERQAALQAAIDAGWIESPAAFYEDVVTDGAKPKRRYYFDGVLIDDMTPAEVNYYGSLCSAQFDRLMIIPKRTSSQ
jgi:hypothetical protein